MRRAQVAVLAAIVAEGDGCKAAAALTARDNSARFLPGQSHGSTVLAALAPAVTFAFGKSAR